MSGMTLAAIEASRNGSAYLLLAEIETPAGTEYYHTGLGGLDYDGQVWTGVGGLASLSGVISEAGVAIQQITASLAVDDATSSLLEGDIKALRMRVWIAFLDADFQVIRDPVLMIDCPLDTATYKIDGASQAITLIGNAGFYTLEQPSRFLWTNEQQQHDFPGDTGFDRAPGNAKKEVTWKP